MVRVVGEELVGGKDNCEEEVGGEHSWRGGSRWEGQLEKVVGGKDRWGGVSRWGGLGELVVGGEDRWGGVSRWEGQMGWR